MGHSVVLANNGKDALSLLELEEVGRRNDLERAATVFAALETELTAVLVSMRSVSGAMPEKQLAAGSGGHQ
jgi:hypothetical protein